MIRGNARVNVDFGAPLHSLVIVGQTHVVEDEYVAKFMIK
jgi:diphthamide biosynthesis methyltransferase